MKHTLCLIWVSLLAFSSCTAGLHFEQDVAATDYAPPRFIDPDRRARVEALLPEVDKIFMDAMRAEHLPGVVYGVILDGQLVAARATGLADVERNIPVARDTRFRIASMTKSFIVMAALKLRDEGRLNLDDPVAKHLPEFRRVQPPTADAPAITIRHLMTMTAGLPEDNPWGDRQMAITGETLRQFIAGGLSFSNPPGQSFEYSNLGYVLLGKIVSKVSGVRFQDYVTRNILLPLGMNDTVWEYSDVPADKLALGYRWENNQWKPEPILHDGDGAAMGGLITTLDDFARYVAFHLGAWPARSEPDTGPVRRATVREMHGPQVFSGAAPRAVLLDGKTPNPSVTFYAYGLGWTRDSRDVVKVSHSGGLPGYGSIYRFCPDHGVAVIAFTNLRYGQVYGPSSTALNILLERGKLPPREQAVSPILETRKGQVAKLIQSWDPALADEIVADNFFLDRSREDWMRIAKEKLAAIGAVTAVGPVTAENQLRGTFPLHGVTGKLNVRFTLSPQVPPRLQELELIAVPNP